jgi:hypothetical protein
MAQGGYPPGQGPQQPQGYPGAAGPYQAQPQAGQVRTVPMGSVPQPPKQSRAMLWFGLGCGGLLCIVTICALTGLYWFWSRTTELERQLAVATTLAARQAQPSYVAQLSGDCKRAYDCCLAITGKAGDAALAAQCEAFKVKGRTEVECTTALGGYVKVAQSNGLSCN